MKLYKCTIETDDRGIFETLLVVAPDKTTAQKLVFEFKLITVDYPKIKYHDLLEQVFAFDNLYISEQIILMSTIDVKKTYNKLYLDD